jgi:uncharacterized membrane protein
MSAAVRYRGVSLLALLGLFMSIYLLLYHMGFYGVLVCGVGSCETVQASKYANFLGVSVPAWGVAWYGAVFVLALLQQAGRAETSVPGRLLAVASLGGFGFSAYLTAIELFVLHAVCLWCVLSAVLAVCIFLLVAPWRALGGKKLEAAA